MSSSMTKAVRNSLRGWPPPGARAAHSSGPSSAIPAAKSTLPSTRRRWRLRWSNLMSCAARQVHVAGFTGVTLHAAHGYLISQFLSPLTNRRQDKWGGSLENRARLLMSVLAAVREAVGAEFPIGIKLNSSDFQKGGFTSAECIELVKMLNGTGLDLLELSGGSLEQPKVMGITLKDEGEDGPRQSTTAREAYF